METEGLDFARISLLLHVVEKASGHPNLKAIVSIAAIELTKAAEAAQKAWEEEVKKQEEEKKKAEAEAKVKADAEAKKAEAEEAKGPPAAAVRPAAGYRPSPGDA